MALKDYPGFEKSTKILLDRFYNFTNELINNSYFLPFQVFVAIIGIFLNIFHLIILSRRDMRTSSTNILMIGMAVYDIGLMSIRVHNHYFPLFCSSSILLSELDLIQNVSESCFRRCTSWLAIMMATVRTIAVKKAMNPSYDGFSRPKCGWYTIIVVSMFSFVIGYLHYVSYYIRSYPKGSRDSCKSSNNTKEVFYHIFVNSAFISHYLIIDSVVSKLIPCISYPILTILLVVELRKARKQRAKVMAGKNGDKGDRTTNLVTYIAVSFMIAELPQGLILFMKSIFYAQEQAFIAFTLDNIIKIFILAGYLNGATHGVICFAMSTKYRDNVWALLRISRTGEKKENMMEMTKSNQHSVSSVGKVTVSANSN